MRIIIALSILAWICVVSAQDGTLSDEEKYEQVKKSYDAVLYNIGNIILLNAFRKIDQQRFIVEKNIILPGLKHTRYMVMDLESSIAQALADIAKRGKDDKEAREFYKFENLFERYIEKPCKGLISEYQQVGQLANELGDDTPVDPYNVVSNYNRYNRHCHTLIEPETRPKVHKAFKKEFKYLI